MILYFSGTGNSKAVAQMLAGILGETARPIQPSMRGGKVEIPSADPHLIWIFPIYSWGVPPYVLDVMRSVDLDGIKPSTPHHAVVTCGDDCGLADRMWRKAMQSRRWLPGSMMSVQMPNNYVSMKGFDVDSQAVEAEKLNAYPGRVAEIARMIEESDRTRNYLTDIVRGSFAWIKTRVIYPWFVRNAMNPAKFSVTESCIACGKCARWCPLGNITMQGTDSKVKPCWGKDCAGCLGCYHICPTHAIDFAKATRNKGQYINPLSR